MGTKNNPGRFDCFAKAEPDEPYFVLLARDRHAPAIVDLWALARALEQEDPEKVYEARTCARAMADWQADRGRPSRTIRDIMTAAAAAWPDPPRHRAPVDPSRPDDLRAAGWRVSQHDDYRDAGGDMVTYWRFERNGRPIYGSGRTDAEALDACRHLAGIDRPPAIAP